MERKDSFTEFLIILIKSFLILVFFGILLPTCIDNLLFRINKSNIYDNSVFVNFVIDKNSKLIYNYIYILKLILNIGI
ncbi:hypothetical protein HMPREF1982_03305 [Clostridiales bacterium oral taxon 876 str. F0540]|nr:hypothetical protein HMPREF1982_03305 [Clostridiales bacterium oral taxon 876 str. F0540]